MTEHRAQPPEGVDQLIGNRAPCVVCGEALVACQGPSSYLAEYDGMIYWRHDRFQRVLVGGPTSWQIADEQVGPGAAIARQAMADMVEREPTA